MASSDRNRLVRPRVVPPEPGAVGTWLLEDVIAERLARGETGEWWICGANGSGLRTARTVLERLFAGDARIRIDREEQIVDRARSDPFSREDLVVRFCRAKGRASNVLELAPWTRDEWIEYLLARHPRETASVIRRLDAGPEIPGLGRTPLVCTAVLDALAEDESLEDACSGLRAVLTQRFGDGHLRGRARAIALEDRQPIQPNASDLGGLYPMADWLAQEPVRLLLAAEAIVLLFEKGRGSEVSATNIDTELLRVVQPMYLRSPAAREEALRVLSMGSQTAQPWAASLVHLDGPAALAACWPGKGVRGVELPLLSGAQLSGMVAQGLDWRGIGCVGTVLRDAQLERCNLAGAFLRRAALEGACLRESHLQEADLRGAYLMQADLEGVDARSASFDGAVLDGATFSGASLRGADLENCSLRGTRLAGADLAGARMNGLDLRALASCPTRLTQCGLSRANLEGLKLEGLDGSGADLEGALLSGTRFPRANFQGASLRDAGLAWIDWEGANLFDADLTGASFHLGSSRSGLVFHAPAGWGTRTGFYTDETKDQSFKPPEEIRKANLRGADLRKALIFGTDFYLVDVRGALYTPDQEKHLRGCGAIL